MLGEVSNSQTAFLVWQEQAQPILEKLHAYLQEQHVAALPKSPLGTAIGYALRNWAALTRYIEDGRLKIDNNGAEKDDVVPFDGADVFEQGQLNGGARRGHPNETQRERSIRMKKTASVITVILLASSLPMARPASTQDAEMDNAKENYQQYCRKCHGETGKGDGPSAAVLNPKPRDFADCTNMQKRSDDELLKAISEGGEAIGMSADMQPWGGTISEAEIRGLLKFVRSFCKK
jgi:cytochrome c oxidase cbb3-type subunit III